MTSLVNRYARERWNLLKDKDPNLSGEDIREGLTAIVSIKLREPQFEGQTKTKLGNADAKTFVQKVTNEQLAAWFDANPAEGKEIARKVDQRRDGADRGPQGARPRAQPQGLARWRRPPRKADRLLVEQPRRVRGLRRRG